MSNNLWDTHLTIVCIYFTLVEFTHSFYTDVKFSEWIGFISSNKYVWFVNIIFNCNENGVSHIIIYFFTEWDVIWDTSADYRWVSHLVTLNQFFVYVLDLLTFKLNKWENISFSNKIDECSKKNHRKKKIWNQFCLR